MSYNGDLYAQAEEVITSKGDLRRGDASGNPERYGIGSTNQILSVSSGNILWKTLTTADSTLTTQGDILFEGASGLERLGQSTDGFVLTTKGAAADPVWAAAAGSWVGTATSNLDMDTYNIFDIDFLQLSAPTELTIATGAVTFSQSYHSIDTEADASSDNLDFFNGLTTGQFLILKSVDNSRDVVLRSGLTGTTKMNGPSNYTLSDIDFRWTGLADTAVANFVIYELSRSDNAS